MGFDMVVTGVRAVGLFFGFPVCNGRRGGSAVGPVATGVVGVPVPRIGNVNDAAGGAVEHIPNGVVGHSVQIIRVPGGGDGGFDGSIINIVDVHT